MRHYFDGDSECEAEIFQELANLLGIKKLQTSGYNIKGNGLSEKLNGVVKEYLLKSTNFFGKEWDQWLWDYERHVTLLILQ